MYPTNAVIKYDHYEQAMVNVQTTAGHLHRIMYGMHRTICVSCTVTISYMNRSKPS